MEALLVVVLLTLRIFRIVCKYANKWYLLDFVVNILVLNGGVCI